MFEELMKRAAQAERGRDDTFHLDRLHEDDGRSVAQKRWMVYLNAEMCRRIGRVARAQQWMNAADGLALDVAPPLWQADMASCQAELELAFDEPDRALGVAELAWRRHLEIGRAALGSSEALDALLDEIGLLFVELCRIVGTDPNVAPLMLRSSWVNDRFVQGTLADASRLVQLAGSLGALGLARTAAADTIAWSDQLTPFVRALTAGRLATPEEQADRARQSAFDSALEQMRKIVRIELDTQLGDAEDAGREHENAMRLFDEAAQLATQMGDSRYWEDRVLQLELNCANQLAKLHREADAQAAYERVLARSAPGSERLRIACRFGIVGCRWRLAGGSTGIEEQMAVVGDLERMFLAEPSDAWVRGMLLSAYRLLVNMIAVDQAALPDRLELLLRVLYAIRTPNAVAMLSDDAEGAVSAGFGLDVLLARWSVLDGAVLLVWETGATDLVLTTLTSGAGALPDRVRVACLPIDRAGLLVDSIEATRSACEQMSMRAIGLKRSSASAMETTTRAVWDALPAAVRDMLGAAGTIYYSPSSQSVLDEFPLEALHDGESCLGVRKVICRVPSLQHLSDVLAVNRYRQVAPPHALLVRAKDPQRAEDDGTVRQQADLIAAAVRELDLQLDTLDEPSVAAFGQAVDEPATLLHFVGHGFAGEGGEVLVISESEQLPIARIPPPGGVRAPFTYFSACEVGRGRQMSSGAQRGLAATFLDAGAPAILAPAYRIPSHFLGLFAALFYQQCAELPAGLALTRTRELLHAQQYHPACWATMTLFGDPFACLTAQASAARPARPTSWKSLVFQHLATQDAQRQHLCLQGLEADPGLDAEVRSSLLSWLRDGVRDAQSIPPVLDRLESQDAEAAALLDILWTLQDVAGVTTESPEEEQEVARTRLRRCLGKARSLEDSYAAVCVIEALTGVGVLMNDLANYRRLLDHEQMLLDQLAADSAALERIATPLTELRKKLATMTFVNIGNSFGYTDEDIQRADDGDPGALRRVALSMLERSAQAEALTGVLPWYVWMLRWGGSGTSSACGDVLAALRMDVQAGRLGEAAAVAVRSFVGELKFASPLDPVIVDAALRAVEPRSDGQSAMRLMWAKDVLETTGRLPLPDVEGALALADEMSGRLGRTGIAAWFRTVLAADCLANQDMGRAARLAQDAVDELVALQGPRRDFTSRLAEAVELAVLVAEAGGDVARGAELAADFADVLAMAGTEQQRLRDEHGQLAEYAEDFRPSSDV